MSIAITNRKGAAHITPPQDAMWHRGIIGAPTGVLNDSATDNFSAEIYSNNEVRIGSGIAMLQGRFWCVPINTYDPLAIANGAQGQNRIDLAVQRWTVDESTNTQDCEWVVIQGISTAGEPVAPTPTEGDLDNGALTVDMPMFQIKIEELTVTAVTPVYDMLLNLEDARISQETIDMFANAGYPITESE